MNNIFQWLIRLLLSALMILLVFGGPGTFLKNDIPVHIVVFLIFTLVLTGILHLVSIIPIFKNTSHFKKYLFAFVGLVLLAVILFLSFVVYAFLTSQASINPNVKMNCSVCEEDQYKDECYYECAMRSNDITICEKTNDIGYKNLCYAQVSIKSNKFFCDKITEGDREKILSNQADCYRHFAVENKDFSLCDKIPLDNNWHLPRYACYQHVIVALQNPLLCAKIPNVYPISGYEKDTALIDTLKQLKSDCLILKQTNK